MKNNQQKSPPVRPKILTLDDEDDLRDGLHRKIIRCTGHENKIKSILKGKDSEPQDICYPKNLRVSSNKVNDSVFTFRQAIRQNNVNHHKYNPSLDSLSSRKLYKGIYTPNRKETPSDGFGQTIDEIVKNRTFLNNTVHMFEMHDIESYQQKRAKRE